MPEIANVFVETLEMAKWKNMSSDSFDHRFEEISTVIYISNFWECHPKNTHKNTHPSNFHGSLKSQDMLPCRILFQGFSNLDIQVFCARCLPKM